MKTIYSIALALLIGAGLNACTPKMTFTNSTIVPSASGNVTVKKDKNKNYVINVSVSNLADPQKLDPAKSTYLVWTESKSDPVQKLGKITPSGKALQGSLRATTTSEPTDVFITAEDNTDIQYPDGRIILTTKK
ncbi:hypothetical protein [Spirosoma validum]|uniref:BIG2 domain-containing protein n=1 Tax=Spirosoma validum TaxID=2771355 RepID=A0A927AZY2_9BACT|nr:hypothetical protein [Spirosoma validum]MBD2752878.1 hypothetical protein [Spirosoma validum]